MNQAPPPTNVRKIVDPVPIDLAGNVLLVSSKSPLPPGSRVNVELRSKDGSSEVCVTGKIVTIDPIKPDFKVKIRLHSVTKEQEDLLATILMESKGTSS